MAGGLLCTVVVLQFAGVIPWGLEAASYIGGRWTGAVIYAFTAGFMFAAGYGWLTVKPWSHMITILAALIGFFVPFVSHMDGTDPRSSAVAPIVISVLMLFMVFRPSTSRAMGLALSGQGSVKTVKSAPPPKPMSAARKRELAQEEAKAAKKTAAKPTTSAPAVVTAAASPAVPPAAQAAPTAVTKSAATAATMVMSAASSLRSAAATPASPRRSLAPASKPAASAQPAGTTQPGAPAIPASTPSQSERPRALRADDV
jgi:hypothetical protein